MAFPTEVKGLTPATEMLPNVCPTPATVEPIEVRLFAMAPVNSLLLDSAGKLTLEAELKYIRVTCVEFIASCAFKRALSALVRSVETVDSKLFNAELMNGYAMPPPTMIPIPTMMHITLENKVIFISVIKTTFLKNQEN
jgi:hypothetical protein